MFMEKQVTAQGIYFNEEDIREIVEKHLNWIEIEPGQTYSADNIMSDDTPIGTSIIVGIDGIRCDRDSNILKLIVSSGIYEIPVKVECGDKLNIRFDETCPVSGTYGRLNDDGTLDILTDEEKEFKAVVDGLLEGRTDEFAASFKKYNDRIVGRRGLDLLEKIKTVIEESNILSSSSVYPTELVSVIIEITNKYVQSRSSLMELADKRDHLLSAQNEATEGSKRIKKIASDIENVDVEIETNRSINNLCGAIISTVINPILA